MGASLQQIESISLPLTQKRIFKYWLPLAASWLLMASEMPFINAVMARLPNAESTIAAAGIVTVISITIESPVISLLSTSTALARSRQNYLMLRKFTIHLMILTTIIHILIGWTPLFDLVVIQAMKIPAQLHAPTRLGLQIMVFWSAAIAWRRFIQGLLIRYGRTRYVGQGTILRLISSAGTAALFALFTNASGVAIATLALTVGVLIEALYATWVARPLIAEKFSPDSIPPNPQPDLEYAALLKFHWPLAASNLLMLLSSPMIATALSRSPDPITDLAVWPVLSGLIFLTRAPAVALPEVIIALYDEQDDKSPLWRFSAYIGLVFTAAIFLLTFTPLSTLYFQYLIGISQQLASIAGKGARFALLLPLITAAISFQRGVLTAEKRTLPITLGMGAELFCMALALTTGVVLEFPGIITAAAAMTLAMAADYLILILASRQRMPRSTT